MSTAIVTAKTGSAETGSAAPTLYERLLARFPQGVHGALFIPVLLAGFNLELRVYTQVRRRAVEVGLFPLSRRYPRVTLVAAKDGSVFLDEVHVPTSDPHEWHQMDDSLPPSLADVQAAVDCAIAVGKVTRGAR